MGQDTRLREPEGQLAATQEQLAASEASRQRVAEQARRASGQPRQWTRWVWARGAVGIVLGQCC